MGTRNHDKMKGKDVNLSGKVYQSRQVLYETFKWD